MKIKIKFILVVFIIVYIVKVAFYINILGIIFPKKIDNDQIIDSYITHEQNFKNVVNELQMDDDTINIIKYPICYSISINYNEAKYVCSKKNYYYKKYINTFKLMKNLKMHVVNKDEYNNIGFTFNSMVGYGQGIVYMVNEQKYVSSGNEIINKIMIKDNWFYTEEE